MNKIANRQVICETLMEQVKEDKSIVALCSDSRGSASMTPFFNAYPENSVEIGIAEQNLVSISAVWQNAARSLSASLRQVSFLQEVTSRQKLTLLTLTQTLS